MQALTPTVFPCYAPQDREIAATVAAFLERGAGVRVFLDEGEMRPGEDLASKAKDALIADMAVVLFSRQSMPSRWPRAQWEEALVTQPEAAGMRIAFVRCDDCVPPRVLAPRFEYADQSVKVLRALKRWVRRKSAAYIPPPEPRSPGHEPDLEVLGIALADRAGVETVASLGLAFEFVRAYREDFDEAFVLECGGRSLTALAGDLASQLGLRLEGDLESNLYRLREFCSARRFLVLLTGTGDAPPGDLIFEGSCSTIIVPEAVLEPSSDPLREVQHTLARGPSHGGWTAFCDQARRGRLLAQQQGRIAECYELMRQWHDAAEAEGDRRALDESARELVWILEGWGRNDEASQLEYRRASEYDEQMLLPF